jgi:hypothetical protein
MLRLRDSMLPPENKGASFLPACWQDGGTPITETSPSAAGLQSVSWRTGLRPAVLLSSTSWSDDEDFQVCFVVVVWHI